jgi:hypothetical protein
MAFAYDQDEYYEEEAFYDDRIPTGNYHDAEGRLIDTSKVDDTDWAEENLKDFVQEWQPQRLASVADAKKASSLAWPTIPFIVKLKRLDIFEHDHPKSQQVTMIWRTAERVGQME